jgi:uncharacterized protein
MIYNFTKKRVIAKNYLICRSFWSKLRGQMFRKNIVPIVFEFERERRVDLHSWFVKEPFDIIFLNSSWEVVELVHEFFPKKTYKPKNKASFVLEMPAGTIAESDIEVGDIIHLKR